MGDPKKMPADAGKRGREQVDSTRSSAKPDPSAKVVEAQNGEEEPVPGRASPEDGDNR